MEKEVFVNAPVTEALLDIQVELPSDADISTLERFQQKIIDSYPHRTERNTWQGGMEIKEGKASLLNPTSGIDGFMFKSITEDKLIQVTLHGFTFNKLKPYTHWDEFIDEARDHWNHFLDIAKPNKITRIGLRYINRIVIPSTQDDLKEYILTGPELSPNLKFPLAGFFLRMVVTNPEIDAMAIITETIDESNETPNVIPLIFDIDIIKENLSLDAHDDFWRYAEDMRNFKNSIFFNSFTDRGKELFR